MTVASKFLCIIQARLGSTRYPNKVLELLGNYPIIYHVWQRAKRVFPRCVIAIPANDMALAQYLKTVDAPFYLHLGDENDVLDRYIECAARFLGSARWVVRITGDCPFIDPSLLQLTTQPGITKSLLTRYGSNIHPTRSYPKGLDFEVFPFWMLQKAYQHASDPDDREHVTPYIRRHYPHHLFAQQEDQSGLNWSVDTPEDLLRLRKLIGNLNCTPPLPTRTQLLTAERRLKSRRDTDPATAPAIPRSAPSD